jgi:orotate phosphoribosyltransferase
MAMLFPPKSGYPVARNLTALQLPLRNTGSSLEPVIGLAESESRWRMMTPPLLTGRYRLWNVRASADRLRPPLAPGKNTLSKSASRARLAEIIRKRSFGRGEITLASGRKSDFYFNLKPTMLDPEGAALLAELTYEALRDDGLDYVGGLEMGAVPLAGAIAQLSWLKGHPIAAFFVRKKPKEHGARLAIEGLAKGESLSGKRVVIVEDVTTTGGSALKAVEAVRDAGGEIALVFTMVDRDEGATETFAQAGIPFRSLYKAGEFLKG